MVGLLQGTRTFYADAAGYWELALTFVSNGHFSLLNFDSPARGYSVPLVCYGLRELATATLDGQSAVVTAFNSVIFALIGAVLAPRLAEVIWPEQRWGVLRRVALSTLLLVFWSGDLSYPMSDFPGLAIGLLALVAISRPDRLGWMFTAGAAAGAAINARPAYLPLIPMSVAVVALTWFGQRGNTHASPTHRALCLSLLLVGFVLVSLPQSLSAHRYYNTWTPIPGSKTAVGTEESVASAVLTSGMLAQRWDSYERPIGVYNAIAYPDEAGTRLLDQQPEHKIKDSTQYLGLIFDHPTIMLPLLARHVINGLDARYSTIYVENAAGGGHIWLRVGGFLLVFLALVRLLWPAARRRLGAIRWRYPLALALCCVTSITSAIETRYMLPLYLLSYMLVLTPGWPRPLGPAGAGWRRFRTLGVLIFAGLVFAVIVWHVVSIQTYTVHPV